MVKSVSPVYSMVNLAVIVRYCLLSKPILFVPNNANLCFECNVFLNFRD